jgi:hypothetical protein
VETVNGTYRFCFLMSGKNEIAGSCTSMFMKWALHLGNVSKARVYILQTPTLAAETGGVERQIYNSTHPTLKRKILGEVYNSEDKDLVEQGLEPHLDQRSI